jgi:predicted amidohydrolase YtcJ
VQDGRIVFVGDSKNVQSWAGKGTTVIDLDGRMVLPGFFDTHIHVTSAVDEVYSVMLNGSVDIDSYRRKISLFMDEHPDLPALQGAGWLPPLFQPEGPSRFMLDELVPHIPVVLYSQDYHSAWVNSRALERAGITAFTADPPGGVIERQPGGAPNGTLRETAVDLLSGVIPPYSVEQYIEGIRSFQRHAHSWGITAVHLPHLSDPERELEALRRLDQEGELALRMVIGLEVKPGDDLTVLEKLISLREAASGQAYQIQTAKIFMDGVIEGCTAYLDEPYAHRPEFRGAPQWDLEHYNEMCAALERAGFQIHVHAIGDAAVSAALDGFAHARRVNGEIDPGIRPPRHGITHLQLVRPEDLARFAQLGAVAFPQPYWFVKDNFYDLAVEYLGPQRADQQYPMKSFFDHGVIVASSSDYPVTIPPRPLDAIEIGIRRAAPGELDPANSLPPEGERVNLRQMIDSFTCHGAQAFFMDDRLGSIETGKLADLVVLDADLFEIPVDQIHTVKVHSTYFNGNRVFPPGL